MFAFLKTPAAWILVYAAFVNLVGFALMGIDKHRSKIHRWRIPEKMLFFSALIGGALGCIMGMFTFRHKTRHWYFRLGMPLIFLFQAAIVLLIAFWFNGPK